MNLPTDVGNQALDAAAVDFTMGDIEEGSRPAAVLLRAYGQCLRQLLRGANWDFARRTADLVLLADATGQTPDVGTVVPVPYLYEYSYPTDCAKARFVPWNYQNVNTGVPTGNISTPDVPLTTGTGSQSPLVGTRLRPAPFVIATDPNYPPQSGEQFWTVQGVSPQGRTVILTNVKDAKLVYTAQMLYPSVWDAMFRAGLVSYLASEIVLPLQKDKKLGMALQDRLIKATKEKITQARLVDGNEKYSTFNLSVDWMNARRTGGSYDGNGWQGAGTNLGGGYGGWDMCGFADGSTY